MYLLGIHDKTRMLHSLTCKNTDEDIDEMKVTLSRYPKSINNLNHNNVPPLLDAAILGHDKCFQFIIESGADVKVTCDMGDVLEVCIFSGLKNHLKCVEYLINNKIFPLENSNLNNYLVPASIFYREKPIIVDLLLKFGAKVEDYKKEKLELKNYSSNSPTVTAVKIGDAVLLWKLIINGGVVDYKKSGRENLQSEERDCLSLIHHTSIYSVFIQSLSSMDVLFILYQFGANFWEKNRLELNPLQVRTNLSNIKTEMEVRGIQYDSDLEELMRSDVSKQINKKMIELMGTPRSLQSICRLHFYRKYYSDYFDFLQRISYLIPDEIISFLQFEGIVDKCVIPQSMSLVERRILARSRQ